MSKAFKQYLLNQPKTVAVHHMIDCLIEGGEAAWALMEEFNGPDWACPPSELAALIAGTLDKLREQVLEGPKELSDE